MMVGRGRGRLLLQGQPTMDPVQELVAKELSFGRKPDLRISSPFKNWDMREIKIFRPILHYSY